MERRLQVRMDDLVAAQPAAQPLMTVPTYALTDEVMNAILRGRRLPVINSARVATTPSLAISPLAPAPAVPPSVLAATIPHPAPTDNSLTVVEVRAQPT